MFIPSVNDIYAIKPLERVTVDVELDNSEHRDAVTTTYRAAFGNIESDNIYITPDKPGGRDLLTVKIFRQATGNPVAQEVVTIKIIGPQ